MSEQNSDMNKIINYLLDDWLKPMHSTSIPLAMENLGITPDDDLRLEIGDHFRKNQGLSNNLKFYGANNYTLSNEEKIITKFLIREYRSEDRMPELNEISEAMGISQELLTGRLRFLERAGLLEEDSRSGPGFTLTEGYELWGGPLRYNFHTVRIDGEFPYDVW
ncbi:hypothetical protein ACFL6G_07510 [candidate division KSB1 bacterium]